MQKWGYVWSLKSNSNFELQLVLLQLYDAVLWSKWRRRQWRTDDERWVILLLCLFLYIDANSFLLAIGRRTRIVEIGRQQSLNWREERRAGSGEHELEAWSTQVRFVLPDCFLKPSLCLTGKEKYRSGSKVAKRWLAGGVGAWSEIQEVERAARSRSWRGSETKEPDYGARSWS